MSSVMSHRGTTRGDRGAGFHSCWLVVAATILLATVAPCPVSAQAPEPGFPVEWSKVEPHEKTLAYRKNLVDGVFEDAERAYLVNNVLPQLGLPANRASIDRVRRRIREVFCAETGSEAKALETALRTTLEFMKNLAANEKADPVVRVNAMLLIGELRAKGKPWPPAAVPLMDAIANPKTPAALRIAAAAGLARHVDNATAPLPTLGPLLVKIAASPVQEGGSPGDNWLAGRALAMLAQIGTSAPADACQAAARVLTDATRPVDVRVRAAAVLGACGQPGGKIDTAQAAKTIRELAVAAVREGLPSAEGFDQNIPAANPAGPAPASPSQVPVLAGRRAAWRLAILARALQADDGSGGIAASAGGDAQSIRDAAAALRKAAAAIDANPDEVTLAAALAELTNQPAPAANGAPQRAPQPERPEPEAPPFANPFGK